MATSNYNLDINKQAIIKPVVILRQGDYGIDTMRVSLSVANEPMDLTGATVKFMGTTAGGRQIIDDVHIKIIDAKGGVFEYVFPSQAAGDIGEYKVAYFLITQANGQSSTMDFRVQVLSGVDISAPVASEYISHYETMVTELNSAYDSATSATNAQMASKVSSLASSAATVLDSALARVNTVNSTANKASSAASNAVSMASSVATTVTSQASYINSVASSAASSVSSVAAGVVDKLNNISVGGRNYALDTANPLIINGTGATNEATSDHTTKPVGAYIINPDVLGKQTIVSYDLTLDTDMQSGSTISLQVYNYAGNWDKFSQQTGLKAGTTHVSVSWNAPKKNGTVPLTLRGVSDGYTGKITISNFSVVLGNIPTDWTPAPEDVVQKSGDTMTGNLTAPQVIASDLLTGFHNVIQVPTTTTKIIDLINNDFINGRGFWKEATYIAYNTPLSDAPTNDAYSIIKLATRGSNRTYVEYSDLSGNVWHTTASINTLGPWVKQANDSEVLHKTGNETVAGDKTFTGNVNFSGNFDSVTINNKGVNMTFKRFGNMVTVIGSGSYTGGDVNTFSKISDGVVPSGYRPSGMALVNANWGSNIGQMAFDSNGAWTHRGGASLSNSWVVITGSWSV